MRDCCTESWHPGENLKANSRTGCGKKKTHRKLGSSLEAGKESDMTDEETGQKGINSVEYSTGNKMRRKGDMSSF